MVMPIPFILAERQDFQKHIQYFDEFDILMSRIVILFFFWGGGWWWWGALEIVIEIADSIFYILQLLPWVIHVNAFLHCFHLWDCVNVPILCPKTVMHTQHIFHHMDCNSANCHDDCILALKGTPFRNFFQKYLLTFPVFQLEVVKSISDIKFSGSENSMILWYQVEKLSNTCFRWDWIIVLTKL
jgi:hypothetical protein